MPEFLQPAQICRRIECVLGLDLAIGGGRQQKRQPGPRNGSPYQLLHSPSGTSAASGGCITGECAAAFLGNIQEATTDAPSKNAMMPNEIPTGTLNTSATSIFRPTNPSTAASPSFRKWKRPTTSANRK